MPQMRLSPTTFQRLNALKRCRSKSSDVLSDPEIRQGIKEFSDLPTIPQVYLNGEFMGGSDIFIEDVQTPVNCAKTFDGGPAFLKQPAFRFARS